ncbi:uncharacterized protein LOC134182025 [Corticium candelabrum]|uniref:uncharacterized protein LOC134182025 n=1 Tax=Corticium candelabrum TaxID=121492 RepID=UPI002E253B70|nr:uncharacterized protein LOC134182025 [Corticium candelabrum]
MGCRPIFLLLAVTFTVFLMFAISIFAGGILNRIRGGYRDVGESWKLSYWEAHVVTRLVFAVPIGLTAGLCGWHLKGGLVVMLMTWFSLYVGWGCYMSIGDNPHGNLSRSGVFDWLIGRQGNDWNELRMVSRDYAGMSLRGLIWTAPSGYALYYMGYGWQYAISGSLMGFIYYLGQKTPIDSGPLTPDFARGIPVSEFYWGAWIWMVVFFSSVARMTEYVVKRWERKSDASDVDYPQPTYKRSNWTTGKFNRRVLAVLFECLHVSLNVVFAASVCFYAIVDQSDVRNKAQTFFGMFTASAFLLFAQAFIIGKAWTISWIRRIQKRRREMAPHRGTSGLMQPEIRGTHPVVHLNRVETNNVRYRGNNSTLSPDPFGNLVTRSMFVPLEQHSEEPPGYNTAQRVPSLQVSSVIASQPSVQRSESESSIGSDDVVPTVIEKPRSFMWDFCALLHIVTGWIRNVFGLLGIVGVVIAVLFTVIDLVWNFHTARFVDRDLVYENFTHAYEFYSW